MQQVSVKRESFASGYAWTFGATALPLISAFIVSLIVARWMGPRAIGLINWAMAFATIVLIPAKFGIEGAASRLVSEYQVSSPGLIKPLVGTSILMRTLFTIPFAAANAIFAPQLAAFFHEEGLVPLFRISGVMIVTVSFNELSDLLILGLKMFRFLFIVRVLMLVIRVGLVFAVVALSIGAWGVLGAYAAGTGIASVVAFAALLGMRGGSMPGTSPDLWRKLLRLSSPLAVSGAAVTVYSMLDKLMLGYFQGASPVGIYSMARNLVETSLFPIFALVMALRPALAGAWAGGDLARCSDLVRRSILNSLLYSCAVAVVFACLAKPLVTGLFTAEFEKSAVILIMFIPMVVMRSIASVILPGLIAADKADTYAKLTLAGAVLNFALNAVMIPPWGAEGAVISTLISYLPVEILGLVSLSRSIRGFWSRSDWIKASKMAVSAVALIAAYELVVPRPERLVPALIHSAALTLVYTALVLAAGGVSAAELKGAIAPIIRRKGASRRGK